MIVQLWYATACPANVMGYHSRDNRYYRRDNQSFRVSGIIRKNIQQKMGENAPGNGLRNSAGAAPGQF
jgi:hypothetical protein